MKKPLIIALLAAGVYPVSCWMYLCAALAQPAPLHSSNPSARLYDDTIIVKYKESSLQTADPSRRKEKMDAVVRKFGHAPGTVRPGLTTVRSMPHLGIHQLKAGPGNSLNPMFMSLRNHEAIESVSYNYLAVSAQGPPPKEPSDFLWKQGLLWGLKKIGMPNAWGYQTDASRIIVAIIDSGIDHLHEDLKPNLWTNSAGNHGFNVCTHTEDSADVDGHGTQVAGIIGAKGNNAIPNNNGNGVGVSWQVQLLAIKWLCKKDSATGLASGGIADAIEAMDYAMSKGAMIINNSWRIQDQLTEHDILPLKAAVLRTNCQEGVKVIAECKPALFVVAAGNGHSGESLNSDNNNGKVYPANFSDVANLIAVAATTCNDATCSDILWNQSHYGLNTVHIAAPGNNIETTYPLGLNPSGTNTFSGTSAAVPHVSGCAALLQARSLAIAGSVLSIADLKNLLFNNAEAVVKDPNDPTKFGVIGGRRLNCARAMAAVGG